MNQVSNAIIGAAASEVAKRIAGGITGIFGRPAKSGRGRNNKTHRNRRSKRGNLALIKKNAPDVKIGKIHNVSIASGEYKRKVVLDCENRIIVTVDGSQPGLGSWMMEEQTTPYQFGLKACSLLTFINLNDTHGLPQAYKELHSYYRFGSRLRISKITLTFEPMNALLHGHVYPSDDIYYRAQMTDNASISVTDLRTVSPRTISTSKSTTVVYHYPKAYEQLNNLNTMNKWLPMPSSLANFRNNIQPLLSSALFWIEMPFFEHDLPVSEAKAYHAWKVKVKLEIALRGARDVDESVSLEPTRTLAVSPLSEAEEKDETVEHKENVKGMNITFTNSAPGTKRLTHQQKRVLNHINHKWEEIFTDPNCMTDSEEFDEQ